MLLVILGISIVGTIVFMIINEKSYSEWPVGGLIVSVPIFLIAFIATLVLGIDISNARVIDDKIAMYQEENEHIEQQIRVIVDDYMEYESDTFEKVKGEEDPITYVTLFPELKSKELVAKQIEIYQENNQEIKELKCEKLDLKVKAWWVYFGGGE